MWRALALLVMCSCKRSPPPPTPPAPPLAVIVDAAPAASASATPDPSLLAVKDVAKQWNDAINAKDVARLGALHDANVWFYGLSVDNATYCSKMKAALAKDPGFRQEIDAIRVEWPGTHRAKLWFRKKDNKAEHAAYLVMTNAGGSWKIVEESDFATDVTLKCVRSADDVTLTGTIAEGSFMWHDSATPTTVLNLEKPICVVRSGTDYWGEYSDERMDGIDSFTLLLEKPKPPTGTKVRVKGNHAQPHSGSGHYSTSLLLFVESITPL